MLHLAAGGGAHIAVGGVAGPHLGFPQRHWNRKAVRDAAAAQN
jgi:hypothetical protein